MRAFQSMSGRGKRRSTAKSHTKASQFTSTAESTPHSQSQHKANLTSPLIPFTEPHKANPSFTLPVKTERKANTSSHSSTTETKQGKHTKKAHCHHKQAKHHPPLQPPKPRTESNWSRGAQGSWGRRWSKDDSSNDQEPTMTTGTKPSRQGLEGTDRNKGSTITTTTTTAAKPCHFPDHQDNRDPSSVGNYPEWDEGHTGAEEIVGGEGAYYEDQSEVDLLFDE